MKTCLVFQFSILFSESKEEAEKMEKEITEIEGLIPEIREKIADTKDMQQESVKRIGDRRLIEDAMAAKIAAEANKDQNGKLLRIENNWNPRSNKLNVDFNISMK